MSAASFREKINALRFSGVRVSPALAPVSVLPPVALPPEVVHLRRCSASGQLIRWYAAPSASLVAAATAGRAGVAAELSPLPQPSTPGVHP